MGSFILTIDDSLVMRKIMEASLQRAGFQTASFGDGRQALQALVHGAVPAPAVIFIDVCLPNLDGYAVARAIQRLPRLGQPIVILLSGRASLVDRVRGRLAGASAYLTKPFRIEVVLAVLRHQLAVRAAGPAEEQGEGAMHIPVPLAPGGSWTPQTTGNRSASMWSEHSGFLPPGWSPSGSSAQEPLPDPLAGRLRRTRHWRQGRVTGTLMLALLALVVLTLLVLLGPPIGDIFSMLTHGL